jgi:hypothetical protein
VLTLWACGYLLLTEPARGHATNKRLTSRLNGGASKQAACVFVVHRKRNIETCQQEKHCLGLGLGSFWWWLRSQLTGGKAMLGIVGWDNVGSQCGGELDYLSFKFIKIVRRHMPR